MNGADTDFDVAAPVPRRRRARPARRRAQWNTIAPPFAHSLKAFAQSA